MSLENLAEKVYPVFMKNFHGDSDCKLFLSASDMKTRAIVRHAHANSPEEAWKFALEELKKVLQSEKIKPKIFRADWVVSSEKITWKNFIDLLRKTRRNYFRKGLALDEDYKISFTEQELNGNSMLYKDGKEGSPQCVFRKDRSDKYCQTRFGCDFPELDENKIVEIFETDGAFVEEDEEPKLITGRGIYSGHRDVSHRDPKIFMDCAKKGANYLARQVQKNGKFIYGVWSCFDKKIPSYNTIRHFSSISSMLDVYRVYKKMPPIKLGKAIISATEYGVKNLIVQRKLEDGTEAAYPVDKDTKEIRLGALGIALLTLSNYTELMHTKKYVPLMNLIARGIMSMQNEDGSFVHVLNSDDFSLKESFRIVYYDGEAVLGLLKLYAITQDEKLLQTAEKAFTRFVETNHWKNHDHWLSYAVNELTRYKPEKKYFEFGINNFLTFLPFIYHRDTQFPTLLELMAAADIMLERMKTMPEMSDLLEKVNFDDFYSAMENRAKNTLNGYFWAELAMYFANPERIVEGFFIRHHAFRVRIDDVQHFLSGFVLYSNYLERRKDFPAPVPSQALLEGRAEGTGLFNIQSTEQNKKISADKVTEKLPEKNLEDELQEISLENFRKKFESSNSAVFFMLRNVKKIMSGLEMSSFRRAKLFKKYFDVNVCLVTHEYQTDIPENLAHHELDNNFLNLYDYFQEIDRKNFIKPSAQIVSPNPDQKIYRDNYDPLGFLSRRQKINLDTNTPTEIIYFRPDGSETLREFYEFDKDKNNNILKSVEVIGKDKTVLKNFSSHEKLLSYWLLNIFNDKEKNYFLIGDRTPEYTETYINIKSAGLKNIHVFHQIHSMHVAGVNPFKSRTNSRYKYLENKKLKTDGIISCTEGQKKDIVKRYNLNNVIVIPHAKKNFSPSNAENDSYKIIFVGRLSVEKNPDKVLEAFKIVSQKISQAHLHFYGKGSMQKEIQEKINSYGLQDKVFFEGFVTNISDAYSSAALSVCASNIEGFSMAIQESLQMSCPVVSFDCFYGPSDMIKDGENGFLVPPGDVETMAQKIILILQNPELRKKLSENAPKSVEKYSQPVVAKKWASLFSYFLTDNLIAEEKISVEK